MQPYNHFTLVERENLRVELLTGKSLRQIAKALDRNVSSISRELKRNGKKMEAIMPGGDVLCIYGDEKDAGKNIGLIMIRV